MTQPVEASRGARWTRFVPIAGWLPQYRRRLIVGDVLAGLVVAALAIPQSLGYAGIAGVPIIVGLYSIPLALIAYAVLGSSPHLVVGPVSTVSVLSGTLVLDLSHGDPATAVGLTSALAIGAGVGLVLGGVARLGWAAEFLSRPIVTGFVFGLVLLIILGEIPSLLGVPSGTGDVFRRFAAIVTGLPDLQPLTAALGIGALIVLFVGARLAPRIPWSLIVLVGAIAASSFWDLASDGVVVVGNVPTGLPPLGLPDIAASDIPPVLVGGLALALVGLAEGLSAARLFAAREGYSIDTNQELLATGAANVAAGLSGGMGVAGSLSKTAASRRSGGSTQMTGIAAALIVFAVILWLAGLLSPLPRTVLSAIVIQAVWGLMDVRALRRYKAIRRNDFVAAIAAMVGVLVLGPLYGLLVAVGLAVLGLVYRSSRVEMDVMGKVPDEKAAWGSITNHPERMTTDGILVLRLDVPLFWANATQIHDQVLASVDSQDGVQALLLDLEATSQLDTTSIDMLELLLTRLQERGIDLYLVRVFFRARQTLARAGFIDLLGEHRMWHSISAGVRAARHDANLQGKAHPQAVSPSDLDVGVAEDATGGERIAVDHDELSDVPGPVVESGPAPRGGYQDPDGRDAARRRTGPPGKG
ncbi:MAG: sulfate permease, SulP family [Actinomycetota bacterium]|nr:sulfate permease, SulP family [Actinomycetota bacterium]